MKRPKKGLIIEMAALVAGAAAASKINNMALPIPIPEKFKPAIPIVLGFLLGKKGGPAMKALGAGMVAYGGMKLIGTLAPQLGIGGDEGITDYTFADVNGPLSLSGPDEMMSGRPLSLSGIGDDSANRDLYD